MEMILVVIISSTLVALPISFFAVRSFRTYRQHQYRSTSIEELVRLERAILSARPQPFSSHGNAYLLALPDGTFRIRARIFGGRPRTEIMIPGRLLQFMDSHRRVPRFRNVYFSQLVLEEPEVRREMLRYVLSGEIQKVLQPRYVLKLQIAIDPQTIKRVL